MTRTITFLGKGNAMSRKSLMRSTNALPLCIMLSACGGGGGSEIASTPPPPPMPTPTPSPTPTPHGILELNYSWLDSPATRAGTYDLIGRLSLSPGSGAPITTRGLTPGELTLASSQAFTGGSFSYRLDAAAGILPGGLTSIRNNGPSGSWIFNDTPQVSHFYPNDPYEDYSQVLGQRLTVTSKAADGTETPFISYDYARGSSNSLLSFGTDEQLKGTLDYDVGYSYVAMGEWSWRVVDLNGNAVPGSDFGDLLFVNGDRTPASGIPVSGTATYDARSLALKSSSTTFGIPFALTADFGQRMMSTRIDQDYRFDPTFGVDDPIEGIHVAGSAPFSNSGGFDIPLTGTANYSDFNASVAPPSEAVTGTMNGGFFGPHAEQVGGVFSVNRSGGALLMQDAFVGQQHKP